MPSTLEGGPIPGLGHLILRTALKYLVPESKDIKEQGDSERVQGNLNVRKIHECT